ncbi:hypothetical protein EXIGLDRAFT_744612 [Exidia glandulosa HHB12029]|uniref:ZZ-type domain-containing protein n=1 Tax=Exidia glandulosa HHB12029 TaxID=1314781 RepID=A0A165PP51_EXIGL|nr:hypothetical protein EXIGLDRAFT_744612 [Exidia glandulosa HHB12029]
MAQLPPTITVEDELKPLEASYARRVEQVSVHTTHSTDAIKAAKERAHAIENFYDQNSEPLKAVAYAALNGVAKTINKSTARDILGAVNTVLNALGVVEEVPAVTLAVKVFKGIVTLEIDRQDNEKRVAAVLLEASFMMSELLELSKLPRTERKTFTINTYSGYVQEAMVDELKDCGNTIDKYIKSHAVVKFLTATSYREEFKKHAENFATLRGKIQYALMRHVAVRVEDSLAQGARVEQLLIEQKSTIATIDQKLIAAAIDEPSVLEEKLAPEAKILGGVSKCRTDNASVLKLAERVGAPTSKDKTGSKNLDSTILHDLRTPLKDLLKENKQAFMRQLECQTVQLTEVIHGSADHLMHELQQRSFQRVNEPHIRYLWKKMLWSLSAPTSAFLAALYEYFSEELSRHFEQPMPLPATNTGISGADSDTSHILSGPSNVADRSLDVEHQRDGVTTPPDAVTDHDDSHLQVQRPASPAHTLDGDAPDAISPTDLWCLEYLDVFYIPSLREAFDSDNNGFVNVREVNAFTASFPIQWTIMQKLAYAAAGWRVELLRYQYRMQALLNYMVDTTCRLRPENRGLVCRFLNSSTIDYLKEFVRGIYPVNTDVDLDHLVTERMSTHEAVLRAKLEAIHYDFPTPSFVKRFFGKERFEQYLIPVLFFLLKRDAEVIELAKSEVLDRRELESAERSMMCVMQAGWERMNQLAETHRQQGLDPATKFETLAGGLYRIAFDSSKAPNDVTYWRDHQFDLDAVDVTLSVIEKSGLLFQPPLPVDPTSTLTVQDGGDQSLRKQLMDQYMALGIAAALDDLTREGPPYLSPEQSSALQEVLKSIDPNDLSFCRAYADMQMRRTVVVHNNSCDGCHRSPLTGNRYDCLDCANVNYQLCSECLRKDATTHTYSNSLHKLEHNMIVYSVELTFHEAARDQQWARRYLRYFIQPGPSGHPVGSEKEDGHQDGGDQEGEDGDNSKENPDETREAASSAGGEETGGQAAPATDVPSPRRCADCSAALAAGEFYFAQYQFNKDDELANGGEVFICTDCWAKCEELLPTKKPKHLHFVALIRSLEQPSVKGEPPSDLPAAETKKISTDEAVQQLQQRTAALDERVKNIEDQLGQILQLLRALQPGSATGMTGEEAQVAM